MMYTKYCMDQREIKKMLEIDYVTVACQWLGSELTSKVEVLEVEPVKKDLFLEYLESIKDKFLFKDEQAKLKTEFIKIGLKDRTMGFHTLNGKLRDMKYPYEITKDKDSRRVIDNRPNENRNKWYWIINKIS